MGMHLLSQPQKQDRLCLSHRRGSIRSKHRRQKQGQYADAPTAQCLLSTAGAWDFNVFNLDKLTNGRSLFHMLLHLFQDHNLISVFNLDIVKLMRCFTMIEEGYHNNNPYHNSIHAADVTQAMHCYLSEKKIRQHITPLEAMIALLSAASHDLDHPGVNQAFLIATSNPLATLYKNSSVLENHHWRSAIGILHESGVFTHLDQETRNVIEWLMKSLILATDITRQQEFLMRFKRHLDSNDLSLEKQENRHFTLQIALKCADICNPCKPWALSKQWSERVCDEFFQQGDYERKLQLPVTPLCDRYKTTVAKIQSGFMQFVVLPLFTEWSRFNPTPLSQSMLHNIRFNKSGWDRIIQETEATEDSKQEEDEDTESSEEERRDINKENEIVTQASVHQEKSNSLTSSQIDSEESTTQSLHIADSLPRRHSLPPPVISRDLKIAFPRRGSFPKIQTHLEYSSKQAKTLNTHGSTSVEKLARLDSLAESSPPPKLDSSQENFSYDLEDDRPKITSLSFECQKGRLLRLSSHTAQVHPVTDSLVSRYHRGRGSLPTIRLPQSSRIMLKDLETEPSVTAETSKYSHHNDARRNTVIGLRQILRPLNTNNSKMSVHEHNYVTEETVRHTVYDRPRSLSLEIESQPLLRINPSFNHHNPTADPGIGEEDEMSSCVCPSQSNPSFSESQELLPTSSALAEDTSDVSVPLLPDQFSSLPAGADK